MTDCQRCQEDLDAVLIGIADADTTQFVRRHLTECPECAREAAQLQAVLGGLLSAPAAVPMPKDSRDMLLARARQTPLASAPEVQRAAPYIPPQYANGQRPPRAAQRARKPRPWAAWGTAGLGLAAALAAFVFYPAAQPNTRQADVVISAGDSLVLARSDSSRYPLVIRAADGQLRGVALKQPRPAWYTEGVYSGGKAYLLDAANEQLVVLNMSEGKVEQTYSAPGGAAGLAVQGDSVFVKSAASGEIRIFKGDSCFINKLAKTTPMPQAEYMDAVLPLQGRILTTQHATGQIFALSADGERVLATYNVGGAPVGLKSYGKSILVLDVAGRLLQLGQDGQIERTLTVPGHPDKLSVMDDEAYLTDRGGSVSVVSLADFQITQQRTFGQPMDIVALPDGHLALADAVRGLVMLDAKLTEL
ncbi:hypothetical protein [Deinococcus sp.]|uniref:hypothetical protein n=1 Tax=Deinococcus sp. TaxID=47478 RepID=UPI003B591B10